MLHQLNKIWVLANDLKKLNFRSSPSEKPETFSLILFFMPKSEISCDEKNVESKDFPDDIA